MNKKKTCSVRHNGRTVLNRVAFNLLSNLQSAELERTDKHAPSKPMLKAKFSNPEILVAAMAVLLDSKN